MQQNFLLVMPNEFELIKQFTSHPTLIKRPDVILGPGDDCALLQTPANQLLAVSIDTFTVGTHFFAETAAYDIGYKALAVNLSDLAAMGADPAWYTCALTFDKQDNHWLREFADGMFDLAKQFNVQIVGGNLARGPLSISIAIHGFVPPGKALRRDGAKPGDAIYISGQIGAAALALRQLKNQETCPSHLLAYLHRPKPRITLGLLLRGKAHSAIDISDGLVADLGHILEASKVGASIFIDRLPTLSEVKPYIDLALSGGDDYELCFTAPPGLMLEDITCIGYIDEKPGIRIYESDGSLYSLKQAGYKHF